MYKLLIILMLVINVFIAFPANAYDYDPLLIRAQASIFPKIVLLDKNLESKYENGNIVIVILHVKDEKDVALNIKALIVEQYKNNLGKSSLLIEVTDFDRFNGEQQATAYFLLKGTEEMHNKITAHAAGKNRLVFSYDYKDFKNNALISVLMKEKTYIYLNKQAVHSYDIKFLPLFYKIVKVIE